MNWIEINSVEELIVMDESSKKNPDASYIIFKHSTRCSVSRMAHRMMEREWQNASPVYLINVVENRAVSNDAASKYRIQHESPQVLLVKNGACIYDASHSAIEPAELNKIMNSKPA